MRQNATATLEFWFDFASTYSYLSVMRIRRLARDAGVTVVWRPFLLGPIFKEAGMDNSPFVLQANKGDYMWRDLERQCAKHGLPWRRPSVFPRNSVLAARIAMRHETQPWMAEFRERAMQANFAEDRDIGDQACLAGILSAMGLDAEAVITAAQSADNKAALRERVEQAKALRIFGAPTFFAAADMFWGNDRLDDALAHALASTQIDLA